MQTCLFSYSAKYGEKNQRIANISINSNIHKNTFRKYFSYEEFEDTKGVFRIRKSKKDRQHNGQKKKDKMTNNDLQNITHKTKRSRDEDGMYYEKKIEIM